MARQAPNDWVRWIIALASLFSTTAAAVWWLSLELHGNQVTLDRIERQTRGRWTAQDMKLWSTQLEADNVVLLLSVPDPWEVVDHRNRGTNGP